MITLSPTPHREHGWSSRFSVSDLYQPFLRSYLAWRAAGHAGSQQCQRTLEPASSVEDLKQEIMQRKVVEESLRASELTSSLLLEKSLGMQEELRHLSQVGLSPIAGKGPRP